MMKRPFPCLLAAAALALTRLGTPDTTPALRKALDDSDWQVRFHAATALETITACVSPQDGAKFYAKLFADEGGAQELG